MTLKSFIRKLPGYPTGSALYRSLRATRKRRSDFEAFRQEFIAFGQMAAATGNSDRFALRWEDKWPCLGDKTTFTEFDRHYIYHTAWAARTLATIKPRKHTDISSTLYFCSIVSAFIPIEFYDYRPANLELDGLVSAAADLTKLPFADGSILSLSCMHVVEHIGLARYGDPLDPEGDLKAMRELRRVLAPGGSLLFVVPVGKPRICFNAHRIYSFQQVRDAFGDLELKEFSLIPDDPKSGGLVRSAAQSLTDSQEYGCGCFWFHRTL